MKICIILPAYNEELCIEAVIRDYHQHLPEAEILVVDNNSSDQTAPIATAVLKQLNAKGRVLFQGLQGKAHAVRLAFETADADVYLMTDADTTYAASDARALMAPVLEGSADMVVGDRLSGGDYKKENKRAFHNFGNSLVRNLINALFRSRLRDIMSGYRVFNRKFVKNFPVLSQGFDLETEMTIHALTFHYRIVEKDIVYKDRPVGSFSKLNTVRDGFRVMGKISSLFIGTKPGLFYTVLAVLAMLVALGLGLAPVLEFLSTGFVRKVPSLIAASAFALIATLTFFVGLLLEFMRHQHRFQYHHQVLHTPERGDTNR